MKIGVLTFHEALNPGSFFQASATMRLMHKMGHDAVIINYTKPSHQFHPASLFYRPRTFFRLFQNLRILSKYQKFRVRQRTKMELTPEMHSAEELAKHRFDLVIVGSDIVWNFQRENTGHDPIYFGHGVNAKRLISYAPSFGAVSVDAEIPEWVRSGLIKFDALSVRDENSRELVRRACGREAVIVVDPTMLVDFSMDAVDPRVKAPYFLVYAFGEGLTKDVISQTRQLSRRMGLNTLSVIYENHWCNQNLIALGPFQWLGYLQNAQYVMTSTFHGTIFSIKSRQKFAVCMNVHIDNKVRPLLAKLGLSDRIITPENPLDSILQRPIDYDTVHAKMEAMVGQSRKFLEDAIAGKPTGGPA